MLLEQTLRNPKRMEEKWNHFWSGDNGAVFAFLCDLSTLTPGIDRACSQVGALSGICHKVWKNENDFIVVYCWVCFRSGTACDLQPEAAFQKLREKLYFWLFPRVGHLSSFLKPHCGFLARICCPKLAGLYAVLRRKNCISLCLASVWGGELKSAEV